MPIPALQSHSEKVRDLIREEISAQGAMSFARYMELALYASSLGYYRSGQLKFGVQGDFVTAPEISPLFSRCVGRQCHQVLQTLKGGMILELGAGTGRMALELLRELQRLQQLPKKYFILELSAELRDRQYQLFLNEEKELLSCVQWLDQLPSQPFKGVILGNEVLDAMPVHKFKITNDGVEEYFIDEHEGAFHWHSIKPKTQDLVSAVQQLEVLFPLEYESEINLMLSPWIASLAEILAQGLLLLIDYGFPRHEYYHPQRDQGTIMCHFQHHAHSNPLIYPGIQDITAHVDFTAVAEAASLHGLDVCGFTHQAAFLINLGIHQMLEQEQDERMYYRLTHQIKQLLLPSEMGELFKVIALTKNYHHPLQGFSLMNQLERL